MVCQRSKQPMPTPVPKTNIPIGHPWQILAVDVLQVPVSSRGNRYLLVFLQDYFTKWAEAISMPNQTAECIAGILIDFVFTLFVWCTLKEYGAVYYGGRRAHCQERLSGNQQALNIFQCQQIPLHNQKLFQRFHQQSCPQ